MKIRMRAPERINPNQFITHPNSAPLSPSSLMNWLL